MDAPPADDDATGRGVVRHPASPPSAAATPPAASRSFLLSRDSTPGALAFFGAVAFSPQVGAPYSTPRAAVALLVIGLGTPALVALLRGRGRGRHDVAAAALAGLALVSAALSSRPALSLVGDYSRLTGALVVVAAAGAWALGRTATPVGRERLVAALVAAMSVNAVAALLETQGLLSDIGLTRYDGRAIGTFGNPVQLGAFAAGAAGLAACAAAAGAKSWLGMIALAAAATQLSGSRFSLGAAALLVGAAAVRAARRGAPALAGLIVAAAVVGTLIAGVIPSTGTTSTARLEASAASGVTPRVELWKASVAAAGERPALGWGPARFVEATSHRTTLALARNTPQGGVFDDAHNVFVHIAVTLGLPALAVLVVWVLSARGASGPLAWFGTGVLLLHLVQPLHVTLTPLAAMAMGAAVSRTQPPPAGPSLGVAGRALRAACVAVSVVVAALLVRGDRDVITGYLDFDAPAVIAADRRLPPWPDTATAIAVMRSFDAVRADAPQGALAEALRWRREAVDRDSSRIGSWVSYGGLLTTAGRHEEARAAFERALERNPWASEAMVGLILLAEVAESDIDVGDLERRLRRLGVEPPDPSNRGLAPGAGRG